MATSKEIIYQNTRVEVLRQIDQFDNRTRELLTANAELTSIADRRTEAVALLAALDSTSPPTNPPATPPAPSVTPLMGPPGVQGPPGSTGAPGPATLASFTTANLPEGSNLYFTDPRAVTALGASLALKLDASAYTAANVLSKLLGVDGAGSGLDADFLNGLSATAFLQSAGSPDLVAVEALSTTGAVFRTATNTWAARALLTTDVPFAAPGAIGNTTPGTGAFTALTANTSVLCTGTGLGYNTGAGGAVTQITSRVTGVTLNKAVGAVTLVSAAGSATFASFVLTNSLIAATDVVVVSQKSGTDLYEIHVTNTAAGSCRLTFRTTGGVTTESPVFNFAVIKGVTA